ncbi:isocitrate lyase/phosphoenolpyruvate mutase family protein [Enterococcus ureasiticus]|uniref:isocitrate lyase/PEP mutase family protein n=1 Tax=Enterococcus ureasiticus TaxID=903984 RepID=UPI001A8EA21D|nr:isocitrate lyase/phosphoenolpyruvate mutase family protein [Enterococcus ureasiticus]MBO0473760.1 isocitrate lyase/phosphoenolpyruvate mutase family protein [Enterococcus ureasiticus]
MNENKTTEFRNAHRKDKPLVLLNIWSVASARGLTQNKITLIPTGSYAMSNHYGYQDGENMPFAEIVDCIKQMNPETNYITADIESGYAENRTELVSNIESLINTSVVGINIEDKQPNIETLYSIEEQNERLLCIIEKRNAIKNDLFINVRTDMYFIGDIAENNQNEDVLTQTITRIKAYEKTGIDGIFIPGLKNKEHIKKIADETTLPINIMLDIKKDSITDYLNTGISRISFGPSIYMLYNESENTDLDAFYTSLLADLAQYEEQDLIELFRIK